MSFLPCGSAPEFLCTADGAPSGLTKIYESRVFGRDLRVVTDRVGSVVSRTFDVQIVRRFTKRVVTRAALSTVKR
jgi:hypothetical protein